MNTNLLKGMKCPQCGSKGPFRAEITTWVDLHDDGLKNPDLKIICETSSPCYCPEYGYSEFLGDFDPLMRSETSKP